MTPASAPHAAVVRGAVTISLALSALVALGCGSNSDSTGEAPGGARSEPGSSRPRADGLLVQLRAGGLVVVFRHAATDPSDEDDLQVDLDDCATQRNLTGEGRADARRIGAAFRELRIPVGSVWASPYCRARDTAELAFGRAEVVSGLEQLYPRVDEAADRRLNRLIREQAPAAGDPNLIIGGHGVYPSVLAPAVTLEEGEAAVYAVRDNDVALIGRVAPDEWADLAPGVRSATDGGLSAVAERVQPSVVSVESGDGEHAGAGFRVAVPRIVVTTAHVVHDVDQVSVALPDGTRRPARVLGRAPEVDIAALQLEDDSGLPPLHSRSGLDAARVGDPVLAVGSPLGAEDGVRSGTLDALEQRARVGGSVELEVLTTDVPVDDASSGAPLVNARGEVLGVSTSIATPLGGGADGMGFAIPVDTARTAALAIVQEHG